MVSSLSLISAGVAGVSGGIVAILSGLAVEKLGGVIGGVLSSLPTNVLPGTVGIFLELTNFLEDKPGGELQFQEAMFSIPISTFCNALFLLIWKEAPKRIPIKNTNRKLALMIVITLSFWFMFSTGFYFFSEYLKGIGFSKVYLGILMFCLQNVIAYSVMFFGPAPAPRGKMKTKAWIICFRGAFTSIATFTAVILSRIGGPGVGGLAAVFPTILITTVATVWYSQGEEVALGAVGPLMIGLASHGIYSMTASKMYYLIESLPLAVLITFIIGSTYSLFAGIGLYYYQKHWVRKRNQIKGEIGSKVDFEPLESLSNFPSETNLELSLSLGNQKKYQKLQEVEVEDEFVNTNQI